eukprot:TRINITY_DN15788_c0_g1_i2.p2 TRINITY_DN15788_c0_g1~~TRINITY_DN15788_c0_g1_i2.p2  ORF type:complete len:251 (+),score=58.11 TRINITY_DN15788_c0_g1_i2:56-754(+)
MIQLPAKRHCPEEKGNGKGKGTGAGSRNGAAAGRPASGTGSGSSDRRPGEIELLAQGVLSMAVQVRALNAVNMDLLLMSAKSKVIEQAQAAGKQYAEAARLARGDDKAKLGSPHLYVWQAIAIEKNIGELREALADLKDCVNSAEPSERARVLGEMVRHARVTKTFKKETCKLEVACRPGSRADQCWRLMVAAMITHEKADWRHGMAPRSNMERQLQRIVQRVTPEQEGEDE